MVVLAGDYLLARASVLFACLEDIKSLVAGKIM